MSGSRAAEIQEAESGVTCDGFDDFVSLVVAAVAGLEGDLVGSAVWGFEPRLQERGQVFYHVLLEGPACSSDLEDTKTRQPWRTAA